jgi:ribosomal protein S18 acetylase RimI-like enzyme
VRALQLPDDLPALLELEGLLFPRNAMGERLLAEELRGGYGWGIGSPLYAYVLAREDGRVVDITRLGVTPGHHGKGIGSQLLEKVISLGKESMLIVEMGNLRALKLYLRYGFTITGKLPTSEAWLMQRPAQKACEVYSVPQPPHL